MEHLDKHIVTNKNEKVLKLYDTNFASGFYFFAFMFLVIYTLATLSSILTPIAIAILIWFLINAFANQIKKIPYFNSNIGEFLSVPISLIIIVYVIFLVGNFITLSMVELSSSISLIDDKINSLIEHLSKMTSYDLMEPIKKLFSQFSIGALINKVIAAFSNIFGNIVQILLYVLFLLIDQRYFNAKINALFPKYDNRIRVKEILESISKTIRTYLFITTIISGITGILTYIVCLMLDLNGAVLWGFLAFILNFIPTIGSVIAVAIPVLYSLIQFSDMIYVLILFICLGIIQFSIGNIIYPKLMGNKLNISQFVVILSLVIWGAMWGTVGMFLSVPLMVIVLIILSQFENTKPIAILISGDGKI